MPVREMPIIFTQLFGNLANQQQAPSNSLPTDPAFVQSLPAADKTDDCECYICLEKLQESKPTSKLPCGHAFDKDCIEKWLKNNSKCPCCRH